ncbi:unnamed protein product [Ixodes persulcatus]
MRDFVHVIAGKEVRIPRGKPELLPDAVPTLLPNTPSYMSKKVPLQRPPRKRKNASVCPIEEKRVPSHDFVRPSTDTGGSMLTNELDPRAASETCVPDAFTRLDVPSEYWSSHCIADYTGIVYCKLKIGENQNIVRKGGAAFPRRWAWCCIQCTSLRPLGRHRAHCQL